VEYVFSDKTGTLTCNIMEFRKFSAGVKLYGLMQEPAPSDIQESNVRFHDPEMWSDIGNPAAENHLALLRVLVFLSVCHTIIVD
jgi:magnesium-transporting ATPase (P-type)